MAEATPPQPSHRELRACREKLKRGMLREVERAGARLLRVRQRLVSLLMRTDADADGCITGEELETALVRVGVTLSPECCHALASALLSEGEEGKGREGKVDYRRMVVAIGECRVPGMSTEGNKNDKNGLVSLLHEYLDRQDSSDPFSPNRQSLGHTPNF